MKPNSLEFEKSPEVLKDAIPLMFWSIECLRFFVNKRKPGNLCQRESIYHFLRKNISISYGHFSILCQSILRRGWENTDAQPLLSKNKLPAPNIRITSVCCQSELHITLLVRSSKVVSLISLVSPLLQKQTSFAWQGCSLLSSTSFR